MLQAGGNALYAHTVPEGSESSRAATVASTVAAAVMKGNCALLVLSLSVTLPSLLQASGEALFSYDMPEEREGLYAAFVASTEALAVIKGIDASEALKVEGVVAFLDAKDVPGENKSDVEEVFASKKVSLARQFVKL